MSWKCTECECNNAGPNKQCVYCDKVNGVITLRSEENLIYGNYEYDWIKVQFYLFDKLRVRGLKVAICGQCGNSSELVVERNGRNLCEKCRPVKMTPEEELFVEFFSGEKDYSLSIFSEDGMLGLDAHIEKLSKIAFEARARLSAASEVKREIHAKDKKARGFTTSVQTDDISSDAINRIKERDKKLSKMDRITEKLVEMGMSRADAQAMTSARNLLDTKKSRAQNKDTTGLKSTSVQPSSKPFVNPFAPKEPEPELKTTATIDEEAEVIIVKETEVKPEEEKPKFFNPFAK
jgi:hypothetical protein